MCIPSIAIGSFIGYSVLTFSTVYLGYVIIVIEEPLVHKSTKVPWTLDSVFKVVILLTGNAAWTGLYLTISFWKAFTQDAIFSRLGVGLGSNESKEQSYILDLSVFSKKWSYIIVIKLRKL